MKVKNKIFIFALILSLIFTVGLVSAEDLSFDQSELGMVSDETELELNQEDLVETEDKNSNSPIGGGRDSTVKCGSVSYCKWK